jgi:hypothetical protein
MKSWMLLLEPLAEMALLTTIVKWDNSGPELLEKLVEIHALL